MAKTINCNLWSLPIGIKKFVCSFINTIWLSQSIKSMVILYTFSGTTWTQELVWLVANNLDFENAKSIPLTDRFPFFE